MFLPVSQTGYESNWLSNETHKEDLEWSHVELMSRKVLGYKGLGWEFGVNVFDPYLLISAGTHES